MLVIFGGGLLAYIDGILSHGHLVHRHRYPGRVYGPHYAQAVGEGNKTSEDLSRFDGIGHRGVVDGDVPPPRPLPWWGCGDGEASPQ